MHAVEVLVNVRKSVWGEVEQSFDAQHLQLGVVFAKDVRHVTQENCVLFHLRRES